jgi:hypothetical protein
VQSSANTPVRHSVLSIGQRNDWLWKMSLCDHHNGERTYADVMYFILVRYEM